MAKEIETPNLAIAIDVSHPEYLKPEPNMAKLLVIVDTYDCIEGVSCVLGTDGVKRTQYDEVKR